MLSPLSWLLLSVLLAGLGVRARTRWLVRAASAVAFIAMVAMTPWAANTLVGWLEAPRPVATSCLTAPPAVAVVLAGGADIRPTGPADFSALAITSRRRVEMAVVWWREQPGRVLIISGGPYREGGVPTGGLMAAYAQRLGVRASALRVDAASLSTWESGRWLGALAPPVHRRIVLITSAMHMQRARYAMTQAGFDVCVRAADPRHIAFSFPGYVIPQSSALAKTEAALHELVGLAYYRWLAARQRPERR